MAIKTVNISFPDQTLEEIDKFAKEEDLSRSDVLKIGARKYIRNLSEWQDLQEEGEKRAKKLGLDSDEKIIARIVTNAICEALELIVLPQIQEVRDDIAVFKAENKKEHKNMREDIDDLKDTSTRIELGSRSMVTPTLR